MKRLENFKSLFPSFTHQPKLEHMYSPEEYVISILKRLMQTEFQNFVQTRGVNL